MGAGLYGYHRYLLYLSRNIKSVSIILGHREPMEVPGDEAEAAPGKSEQTDASDLDEDSEDAAPMAAAVTSEPVPDVIPDPTIPFSLPTIQPIAPNLQPVAINHVPTLPGVGERHGKTGSGRPGGGGGARGQRTSWLNDGLYSGILGGETLSMEELEILHDEIPPYPPLARDKCICGDVMVLMVMDERGIPIDVQLVSAAHPLLVPSVMEAAWLWRFKPAVKNGKKIKANFKLCFRFIIPNL
jgi:hypothetical protein